MDSSLATNAAQAKIAAQRRIGTVARQRVALVVICLLLILLVPSDGYLGPARIDFVIDQAIGATSFQFAAWEVQAIGQKLHDQITQPGANLSAQQQHDLVITYFDTVRRIDQLSADTQRIYADARETNPAGKAAPLQAELDTLRAEQAQRRPVVERILEEQVAAGLQEAGLTTAGRVWPPVRFHFTESPDYLIVSPRNRITVERGVYLDPTLSTQQKGRIEDQVQKGLDVSALVDGTGGFSSYPTMVIDTSSLSWVLDTIAHEWTHTYLFFHPLGWHYRDSGGMRTINETVASMVGGEVSQLVLERFYPEQVGPASWPRPLSMSPDWLKEQPQPPQFDFGTFMHDTRLQVDSMLAAGQITQAEAFMEAQRRILVEKGYVIRKLNQAYFAFHGSYAVGTSATDPIGGKLRALRDRAGSLVAFLHTVAHFDKPADLDAALQSS